MRMQAVLLKCKPGAQFHIGQVGADDVTALNETSPWIHSDTLFSALINTVSLTSPADLKAVIAAFRSGKELRISSAFYCLEEAGERVFFLPKPAHYDQYPPKNDPKRFRGIRFVSLGVWEAGALPRDWGKEEYLIVQNQFVVTRDELSDLSDSALAAWLSLRLYQEQLLPRVDARKPDPTKSHFYSANIQIADNRQLLDEDNVPILGDLYVHFYFLLETTAAFEESRAGKALQLAIQLLPDTGIGGERSIGCGSLEGVERFDFPHVRPGKSSAYATVSLCSPISTDELNGFLAYDTLLRGGRPTTQEGELRMVRMIAEGAVSQTKPDGRIADISPPKVHADTAYLRLGKPVALPVVF